MLAYLDDILEPADAQELGNKIEESEFAGSLVDRVRTSMRRLRLGAPKLEGKGMGLDANTVAEYLDNTLPPDRVPDFEKVCLESDVHLAEVASCHQVLTLVLGEPADVPAAARERAYRIVSPTVRGGGEEAAQVGVDPAEASPVPAPKSDLASVARPDTEEERATPAKREVPEYLRPESRVRIWPLAITLVLAFLLAGAVIMALVPPKSFSRWLGLGTGPEVTDRSTTDDGQPPDAPSPPVEETPDKGADSLVQPDSILPSDDDGHREKSPTDPGDTPKKDVPAPPPEPGTDPPAVDPDEGSDTEPPDGRVARVDRTSGFEEDGGGGPVDVPKEPLVEEVARYISDDQVLARFDTERESWYRLPAAAPVSTGDQLLALPTYRPQMKFSSGAEMAIDGGTMIRVKTPRAPGTPEIYVEYGRLFAMGPSEAGAQIGLSLRGRRGTVTLGDGDSIMAVEVSPLHLPGTDPEATPPHMVCRLYAASGTVQWQEGAAGAVTIEAGRVRTFYDDMPGQTTDAGTLPDWIPSKAISDIDRRASTDLEKLLELDRPIGLTLREQAEHRRTEIRSLAVRCSGYLDQFDPFPSVLADDQQRSSWAQHMDVLKEAISRGPETAALVRTTFEKHRGNDAKELYRMLWGYSQAELDKGEAAKLVAYLDHESLDYRVLAIDNLRRITDTTLHYRADYPKPRRRTHVRHWSDKLESGIKYKTPPPALPETVGPEGSGGTTE